MTVYTGSGRGLPGQEIGDRVFGLFDAHLALDAQGVLSAADIAIAIGENTQTVGKLISQWGSKQRGGVVTIKDGRISGVALRGKRPRAEPSDSESEDDPQLPRKAAKDASASFSVSPSRAAGGSRGNLQPTQQLSDSEERVKVPFFAPATRTLRPPCACAREAAPLGDVEDQCLPLNPYDAMAFPGAHQSRRNPPQGA